VKNYLLRDVEDDFWRLVKIRAAQKEESVRDMILRLLKRETQSK
jgi:hypothetical protein